MSGRRIALALTLALSLVALSGAAIAADKLLDDRKTLELRARTLDFAFLDVCPFVEEDETPAQRDKRCEEEEEAFETGPLDQFAAVDKLWKNSRHVGWNFIDCTFKTAEAGHCSGVVRFKDKSTITWQGYAPLAEEEAGDSVDIAITGGTGRYAAVGGWVHVEFIDDERSEYTVHLIPLQ